MKAYKIELLIIDHDEVGDDDIQSVPMIASPLMLCPWNRQILENGMITIP
jgi:hypothetical protein